MKYRYLDVDKDIELYVKGDVEAFNESFPGVKLPLEMISEITNGIREIPGNSTVCGITAYEEYEPIGFVIVGMQMFYMIPYAYVESIFVEPEYRGKGVGKALLEKAENWGRERGAKFVQLHVSKVNEAALNSYEKSGYTNTRNQMEKML